MGTIPLMGDLRTLTILSLLAVSCPSGSSSTEAPAPPPGAPPATPTAPAAASDGSTSGEATSDGGASAAAPAGIEEAAARQLLDAWLTAQNEGSFESYSALYASRFFGIKRAGDRTRAYDRAGWLRDRQRMFRRAMRVEAAEVTINISGESAVVTFVQRWSSARFSDEGPKQLIVVRQGEDLRIAREEMLASTIRDAAAGSEPFEAERMVLALDFAEGTFVVLRDAAQGAWPTGPVRLVSRTAGNMAAERAGSDALPEELTSWRGRDVTLHGPRRSCQARVTELSVLRQTRPHFHQRQIWDGSEGDPRASDSAVARGVWESAGGTASMVVGRVDRRCDGAVWAQVSGGPAQALHLSESRDEALVTRASDAFRALPRYRRLQREHTEAGGGTEDWGWSGSAPTIEVWVDGAGAPQVVTLRVSVGGCGSAFEGRIWGAFRITGERLVSLSGEDAVEWLDVRSVADMDGDGSYEIVGNGMFSTRHMLRGAAGLREALRLSWPDQDCPC